MGGWGYFLVNRNICNCFVRFEWNFIICLRVGWFWGGFGSFDWVGRCVILWVSLGFFWNYILLQYIGKIGDKFLGEGIFGVDII